MTPYKSRDLAFILISISSTQYNQQGSAAAQTWIPTSIKRSIFLPGCNHTKFLWSALWSPSGRHYIQEKSTCTVRQIWLCSFRTNHMLPWNTSANYGNQFPLTVLSHRTLQDCTRLLANWYTKPFPVGNWKEIQPAETKITAKDTCSTAVSVPSCRSKAAR